MLLKSEVAQEDHLVALKALIFKMICYLPTMELSAKLPDRVQSSAGPAKLTERGYVISRDVELITPKMSHVRIIRYFEIEQIKYF